MGSQEICCHSLLSISRVGQGCASGGFLQHLYAPAAVFDEEAGLDELGHGRNDASAVRHHGAVHVAAASPIAAASLVLVAALAVCIPLLDNVPLLAAL